MDYYKTRCNHYWGVPLNLFGGPGTVTDEMINYISTTLTDATTERLHVFNAELLGNLFDLNTGAVDAIFGLEHRKQIF